MKQFLRCAGTGLRMLRDKSGATAVEYGLIALLVSVGLIAALVGYRDSVIGLPINEAVDAMNEHGNQ